MDPAVLLAPLGLLIWKYGALQLGHSDSAAGMLTVGAVSSDKTPWKEPAAVALTVKKMSASRMPFVSALYLRNSKEGGYKH